MPRHNIICCGLVFLLFFGAYFWAKEQDPFSRNWFTLKTTDCGSFKCIAVFPKPIRPYPVIIYAHDSSGALMNDGKDLRQMSELGLATVSLEYNQTNETAFATELETLLHYLTEQKWVKTNSVAWVGFGLGANWMLDFGLQHPEQQPELLVQISGAGRPDSRTDSRLEPLHCSILLIHSDQDEFFPLADTKGLASILQTNGLKVEMQIIPGIPHSMEPERGVVFRSIGEYFLSHLTAKDCWQKYHSIAQWQAEAPSFWLFCIPASVWAIGWLFWSRRCKVASPKKIELQHHEIVLRWIAGLIATWALAEMSIHLVTPHFSISNKSLAIARQLLVQHKENGDFEYLAAKPIWHGQKLNILLDHVELAGYNRELINWQLNDNIYRDYVLSPVITGNFGEQPNWRRPLWEEFYPRIRHESLPEDAAKIVVRHLRERVTIASLLNPVREVPVIWLQQITDEAGFEIIYVAALRSVGVPARLNSTGKAEFHDGTKWQPAPSPSVISWVQ